MTIAMKYQIEYNSDEFLNATRKWLSACESEEHGMSCIWMDRFEVDYAGRGELTIGFILEKRKTSNE